MREVALADERIVAELTAKPFAKWVCIPGAAGQHCGELNEHVKDENAERRVSAQPRSGIWNPRSWIGIADFAG
jgi:hypothetical protein